jgi:uncharacterized membrane protein YgcG
MVPTWKTAKNHICWNHFSVSVLALGICLGALPALAGQNPPSQPGPPPSRQARGYPATQPAYPQAAPAPSQPVPPTLTLPAGTVIPVRVMEWLSSNENHPGDSFSAMLDQPLVADGWVVSRRGQYLFGRVVVAQKAGHGNHSSRLGLDLNELTLVDGESLSIQTQLLQSSGPNSNEMNGRDAAIVATTTIIGAAIGGAAGGGVGAVAGGAVGATAGGIAVLETPGRPTVLPAETLLTFRLVAPLTISTDRGQVAFQPVTQQDYNPSAYGPSGPPPPAYPPYPAYPPAPLYYPYGYYCPYCFGWGYYPTPFFGFYDFYGFGPRYYGFGRFGGYGGYRGFGRGGFGHGGFGHGGGGGRH